MKPRDTPTPAPAPDTMPDWLREYLDTVTLPELLLHGIEAPPAAILASAPLDTGRRRCTLIPLGHIPKNHWRAVLTIATSHGPAADAEEAAIVMSAWVSHPPRDHPNPPAPSAAPDRQSALQVMHHRRGEPHLRSWVLTYAQHDRPRRDRYHATAPWDDMGGIARSWSPHLDGVLGPLERPGTGADHPALKALLPAEGTEEPCTARDCANAAQQGSPHCRFHQETPP